MVVEDRLAIRVTMADGATELRVVSRDGPLLWPGLSHARERPEGRETACWTLVNASGNLALPDGAQAFASCDEAPATLPAGMESGFALKKEAVGTASAQPEWRNTFSVPGSG